MPAGYRNIDTLRNEAPRLAQLATERQYAAHQELELRYGPEGRSKCLQDSKCHLAYLAEAIAVGGPELFADYVRWTRVLLAGYDIPPKDLADHFGYLRATIAEQLPGDVSTSADAYLERGLQILREDPPSLPSFLDGDRPHATLATQYLRALLATDQLRARAVIADAFSRGISVQDLYLDVFQTCQLEIGRLWQLRQASVAQEHFCTAVTQSIMGSLYTDVFDTPRNGRTAIIACVGQELHELGARMVADFLELDGWTTLYLGANAPAASLAEMLVAQEASLLCLSTTLTPHLKDLVVTIATVRERLGGRFVPVIVGGHPFQLDPQLWQRVGADGCAPDARQAATLARHLLQL